MLFPRGLKSRWILLLGGDFGVSSVAAYGAFAITGRLDVRIPSSSHCHLAVFVLACLGLATIYFQDLYKIDKPRTLPWIGAATLGAGAETAVLVGIVVLAMPELGYGRRFYISYITTFAAALVLWRIAVNRLLFSRVRIGVIALGLAECAPLLVEEVNRCRHLGYRFLGFASCRNGAKPETVSLRSGSGVEVHRVSSIVDLARAYDANILVLLDEGAHDGGIRELLRCRLRGMEILDFASFSERIAGKLPIPFLQESWLLYAPGFIGTGRRWKLKRVVDIAAAILIGVATLPLSLLAALAIKLDSPGPVFYTQDRVGLDGEVFRVYKFRSMRDRGESERGSVWAVPGDDRITRVGRILRKHRIDELPQLFNVLRGDMSIVGPRPQHPEWVETLTREVPLYDYRHFLRPGLTGWAQICYSYGANVEAHSEMLRYDLYYLKNWSLTFDLQIMLQTIKVVLFGRGSQ